MIISRRKLIQDNTVYNCQLHKVQYLVILSTSIYHVISLHFNLPCDYMSILDFAFFHAQYYNRRCGNIVLDEKYSLVGQLLIADNF